MLALFLVHLAASAEAGQVLVLYSNSRLGKGDVAFDSGLRQTINANPGQPIQILSEFLDEPEFGGDRYELTMVTYLRDKYAERPLGAVLTLNDTALRFILRYRDRLFPGCRSFTPGRREAGCIRCRRSRRMSSGYPLGSTLPAPSSRR